MIVVQSSERVQPAADDKNPPGTHRNGDTPALKPTTYAEGADVYFQVDSVVDFGKGRGPVIATGIGKDVVQAGFEGFSEKHGYVNVGPNSAIHAAANYAFTRGAKKIEIIGASQTEIEVLNPWFAVLGDAVTITFG